MPGDWGIPVSRAVDEIGDLQSYGILRGLGVDRSYIKKEKIEEAMERNQAFLMAQAAS